MYYVRYPLSFRQVEDILHERGTLRRVRLCLTTPFKIPLVGKALWAAKRIVEVNNSTDFAFPRYNRNQLTTAKSASAALNKWLRQYVPS